MRWGLIVTVLGAGLVGCNGYNAHPLKDDLQAQAVPTVYCYETLTQSPDCYDVPIEPEVRRLMGYYGPDPVNRGFYGRRAF
ncbi:MAG TPA: hypothetical protein VMB81_18340 [Candidatus Sulfotelmatobacter sp.]|nr:hypothetical protein [Candidatus Sulfotelmatobacter sp.]